MGRVDFGAKEENGKFRPVITVSTPQGDAIEWTANVTTDTLEQVREFLTLSYLILTTKQQNFQYDPAGNIPPRKWD